MFGQGRFLDRGGGSLEDGWISPREMRGCAQVSQQVFVTEIFITAVGLRKSKGSPLLKCSRAESPFPTFFSVTRTCAVQQVRYRGPSPEARCASHVKVSTWTAIGSKEYGNSKPHGHVQDRVLYILQGEEASTHVIELQRHGNGTSRREGGESDLRLRSRPHSIPNPIWMQAIFLMGCRA